MLASLGWALVWHSWSSFLVACLLIPFFMAKARHEEHRLRERFSEYASYAQTTRWFIPWIY